jgi:hypothetical protein
MSIQNTKQPQTFKVSAYWQTLPEGSITDGQVLPQIKLKGFELDEAGFKIGDIIEVDMKPNEITIKKIANGN